MKVRGYQGRFAGAAPLAQVPRDVLGAIRKSASLVALANGARESPGGSNKVVQGVGLGHEQDCYRLDFLCPRVTGFA